MANGSQLRTKTNARIYTDFNLETIRTNNDKPGDTKTFHLSKRISWKELLRRRQHTISPLEMIPTYKPI